MWSLGSNALRPTTFVCAGLLVFFAVPDAQAKTTRQRKRPTFTVALQPFSLVQSAVETVAAPAVERAPRILRAVATAPIKLAYYKQRRSMPRLPRANRADDYGQQDESEGYGQPIRVAYQSARRIPATEPSVEARDEFDWDQDQGNEGEANPQIVTRGDRPIV